MEMESKIFLKRCLYTTLVFTVLVGTFNVLVNPYLFFQLPRIKAFNSRKPAVDTQQHLMKAYNVLRAQPNTIILGSSGMAIGLNAQSAAWPARERPVYNLGFMGEGVRTARRYLQHVSAQSHLSLVVLGLEFGDFLTLRRQYAPHYDSRLTVKDDGNSNPEWSRQRIEDVLFSTWSLDTTSASVGTLADNLIGDSSNMADSGDIDPIFYRENAPKVGSYPFVVVTDLTYSYLYRDSDIDESEMNEVQQILKLCREKKIDLLIVLEPTHADELELATLSGKWQTMENWKRALTNMVAEATRSASGSRAELWDFAGYNAYSTEGVSKTRSSLRWFFSPSHFTHALGDIVVQEINGVDDGSFGVRLTSNNIEGRLAEVRQAQRSYHVLQPADVERVYKLYAQIR